jgi:uncharacterized protein HemX
MKLILVVIVLGAGAWYLMNRAKQNAAVQQVVQAPEKYTAALQNDEARAKAAVEGLNKTIKTEEHDLQKAAADAQ